MLIFSIPWKHHCVYVTPLVDNEQKKMQTRSPREDLPFDATRQPRKMFQFSDAEAPAALQQGHYEQPSCRVRSIMRVRIIRLVPLMLCVFFCEIYCLLTLIFPIFFLSFFLWFLNIFSAPPRKEGALVAVVGAFFCFFLKWKSRSLG